MRGSLWWRVCLLNGAVFALGTLALVLAPVTVSARPLASEVVVLVIGLAVILGVNAVLLRSVLRSSEVDAMLARLEVEQAASTARAVHAQEAERQRIAQELHDEVGQSLTAVLLSLKQGDVELARATTRTTLEEVRRISQALRPGVLSDLGLVAALSSLASDLAERSGVRVERGFAPGLPELSPEAELVVYRVAQEALTNVARHARASAVTMGLSRRGGALTLRVGDDGTGIAGPEGAGIQGMRERAALAGGRLDVRRREGGGTLVELEVPT